MKKTIAALLLGLIAALAFVAPAPAATTVSAGQFCKKSDAGEIKKADNGDWVRCEKVGDHYKWVKTTAPSQSASASKSASASSSASSSASASASASSSTTPSTSASATASSSTSPTPAPNTAALPVTGAPVPLLILAGLVVAILGAGLYMAARRRTRFTA